MSCFQGFVLTVAISITICMKQTYSFTKHFICQKLLSKMLPLYFFVKYSTHNPLDEPLAIVLETLLENIPTRKIPRNH